MVYFVNTISCLMADVVHLSLVVHMNILTSTPWKLKPLCFIFWQFISIVHAVLPIILD